MKMGGLALVAGSGIISAGHNAKWRFLRGRYPLPHSWPFGGDADQLICNRRLSLIRSFMYLSPERIHRRCLSRFSVDSTKEGSIE